MKNKSLRKKSFWSIVRGFTSIADQNG